MQLLNVYVEGAKDPSAEGLRRVAAQIAARYGLAPADLEKRLSQGRFRVKANVDEETAQAFAADLESLGARCSVVAAGTTAAPPSPSSTLTGLPPLTDEPGPRVPPAPPPVLARPGAIAPPAPVLPRTSTLPMTALPMRPAAPAEPSKPPGLAAALADATFAAHAVDNATFSLAKLDEREVAPPPPPAVGRATLMGVANPLAKASSGAAQPLFAAPSPPQPQPFAPPPGAPLSPTHLDAATAFQLSPLSPAQPGGGAPLSADARFSPPPEHAPHLALEAPPPVRGHLAMAHAAEPAPPTAAPFHPTRTPVSDVAARRRHRLAFAVGVAVCLAIGFAPAHLIAAAKERSAYTKIDNRVRAAQSGISTAQEWRALDDIRTARMRDKRGAQQEIVLLTALLWLGLSAGLSFAWTRWGLPRVAPAVEE